MFPPATASLDYSKMPAEVKAQEPAPSMLAHILAGLQYVIGDLQADDSPSSGGETVEVVAGRDLCSTLAPDVFRFDAESSAAQNVSHS